MPYWVASRNSRVAKAFTRFQSGAIGKFGGRNLLASFDFDGHHAQNGCVAAHDEQFVLFAGQSSWRNTSSTCRQVSAHSFRHRLSQDVARLPAKSGVGARPGGQAPHSVVNLSRGTVP